MTAKGTTRDQAALEGFLKELARLLLSAGISFPHFEKAAQSAFVSAALDRGRLRNSRVNQSAVAAITGISRTTIRATLRGSSPSASRSTSRLLSLVYGWTTNSEFLTDSGVPKALPVTGRQSSFQRLAQVYGGDVSARTLLAELRRMRMATVLRGRVRLRISSSEGRYVRELRSLSIALERTLQHAATAGSEPHIAVGGGEIRYRTPASVGKALLRRRVRQGLGAFLADIEGATAVATRTTKSSKKKSGDRMSKISVLVVSQE